MPLRQVAQYQFACSSCAAVRQELLRPAAKPWHTNHRRPHKHCCRCWLNLGGELPCMQLCSRSCGQSPAALMALLLVAAAAPSSTHTAACTSPVLSMSRGPCAFRADPNDQQGAAHRRVGDARIYLRPVYLVQQRRHAQDDDQRTGYRTSRWAPAPEAAVGAAALAGASPVCMPGPSGTKGPRKIGNQVSP